MSEAPFQWSDSFPQPAVFQSNNNAEHSQTGILKKNFRVVPHLTFDLYTDIFKVAIQQH